MKKKIWLKWNLLAVIVLATACSEESVVSENEWSNEAEVTEIDLSSFSYEDVKSLLAGKTEVQNVIFRDGEIVKKVKKLSVQQGFELVDQDMMGDAPLYMGAPADSIDLNYSPTVATVRFHSNGKQMGYVAYANVQETTRAMMAIQQQLPQTRSAQGIVTRAAAAPSFKIDITAGQKMMTEGHKNDSCISNQSIPVEDLQTEPSPATRSELPYYTQWPRGNTLTIHLIRDESDYPWEHELTWAVNDMIYSLKNIRSDLNVKVWRSNVHFRGGNRAASIALDSFKSFCRRSDFPWKEAAGHDIFVAVRHFGIGSVAGYATVSAYKLSRWENPHAYGIASTTCWDPYTLAHEVGHILGAQHVKHRPWWQVLVWKDDLMVPTVNWFMDRVHQDEWNRRYLSESLRSY